MFHWKKRKPHENAPFASPTTLSRDSRKSWLTSHSCFWILEQSLGRNGKEVARRFGWSWCVAMTKRRKCKKRMGEHVNTKAVNPYREAYTVYRVRRMHSNGSRDKEQDQCDSQLSPGFVACNLPTALMLSHVVLASPFSLQPCKLHCILTKLRAQ